MDVEVFLKGQSEIKELFQAIWLSETMNDIGLLYILFGTKLSNRRSYNLVPITIQ